MYILKFIKAFVILLEKISPFYVSVNLRLKTFGANEMLKYPVYEHLDERYAIVMQGPLINKDHFTLETLKLYRHIYPGIQIVLSTWKIDDKELVGILKDLRIKVIQNERPNYVGACNINLQITSTVNGLQSLDFQKVIYVLKTRSDQRCCKAFNFLEYMNALQGKYPLQEQTVLKERLIIASLDTYMIRLYGVTDMFMFGTATDMLKYWDIPLDGLREVPAIMSAEKMISFKIAEGYILDHFFKTVGFIPNWSLADSNHFFSKYFCIIDKEQLDLFWFKYNRFFDSIIQLPERNYKEQIRREYSDWF